MNLRLSSELVLPKRVRLVSESSTMHGYRRGSLTFHELAGRHVTNLFPFLILLLVDPFGYLKNLNFSSRRRKGGSVIHQSVDVHLIFLYLIELELQNADRVRRHIRNDSILIAYQHDWVLQGLVLPKPRQEQQSSIFSRYMDPHIRDDWKQVTTLILPVE